ncbi:hypothetical protein OMP38_27400 [Cohnella ginsengisoli]|uniref:Uncharacterized protein n=1 Tax=Cohnella ginsengisoli TaxID=425004 RepID=A0A9X4KLA8_9BACL|nr:hypothetical protein [Cohnella ginsengisoli]MDG0794143.1 hypothetical protein [Cohnella ginsengisoli]
MKWTVLLFFVLATALTGCSNDKKTENVFQPLPPTPEYIVVVKKQTPNVVLGHRIIQNEEMDPIVQQINESHPSVAFKSCPASVNFFDVLLHYANGSTDRTLKVLLCPGTVDQLSGVVMEPGVLF